LTRTNSSTRRILIGDADNKQLALQHGWEHYNLTDFSDEVHVRFNSAFKHIQGREHSHIRNGRDWLKFVFERWFVINAFIKKHDLKKFWHFDSDTMVLHDLSNYVGALSKYDFTLQCNNTCLNGLIGASTVEEYCLHICELFENPSYLLEQQYEFDTVAPTFAFTEMRAFDDYQNFSEGKRVHLLTAFDNLVFDDCICQEHGFNMTSLPSGEQIKNIFFEYGKTYGYRDNELVEFATLNLSWVPDYLFAWVLTGLLNQETKSLIDINVPLKDRIVLFLRSVSRKLKNVRV
jgi:hypothetical protein